MASMKIPSSELYARLLIAFALDDVGRVGALSSSTELLMLLGSRATNGGHQEYPPSLVLDEELKYRRKYTCSRDPRLRPTILKKNTILAMLFHNR
ncbi:L-cysteine desulfhydrase 1 [Dorcoceras hygrometricum]|uniref:L-cysteine desulfhydrase 1 n=1 Tax=Dorcoceras hygrometricum TaxID=472368 RepID=A0A2Z7CYQ8_9LAMI|nr:L-cysteine desulfhydrase 1 [Dorcoceras hygrometricum]